MTAHGEREHATWSASSTARHWECAGSLALEELAPPDTENPAAAWGTACHQLSEKCLRSGDRSDAAVFLGAVEKTKAHSFIVDDEMADTAQVYIDYVRSKIARSTQHWIEERFTLASLEPPFDAGGTGDAVIYSRSAKSLEIIDLKGGRGVVVEVAGNAQGRSYALGAMLAHPLLPVTKIIVTIVQPRAPHKDGIIRSEEFHVADLIEWASELMRAMRRSDTARQLLDASRARGTRDTWDAEYLKAGPHCNFCRAAATCPAIEAKALETAGVWFDDLDTPRLPAIEQDDGAEIARKLDLLDMISDWAKAYRAYAHRQAEAGVEIPGYQLAEKIGARKWRDEDETRRHLIGALGLSLDDVTIAKMKSPAMIEKVLGSKRKSEIADLVVREVTGVNLVATTKTSRPALPPAAQRYFQPTEN